MICYLCQQDAKLKKSHIIPEFVYTALYDKKHKFHVLSTHQVRPRPMEQKGIRERLLCGSCEQHLSKYEKYAREVLLGGISITVQQDGNLIRLSDLNYRKFKLFQLSILWRASIASNPMFSKVNLGPHEEYIRKMIHDDNPGEQIDYPCILFGLTSKTGIHGNFIDQPRKLHIDGHTTYRFIFTGFMWSFYVSSHRLSPFISQVAVNEAGNMVVGRGAFEELTELKDFALELHKMGRMNKPTEKI